MTDLLQAARKLGETGSPPIESERLAFEEWMAGHCWGLSAHWDGKQYVSDAEQGGWPDPRAMMTRRLWAAWRDRAALAAHAAPAISTEHGPWLASYYHSDETYCKRCLVRSVFADSRKCEPHIVYPPTAAPTAAQPVAPPAGWRELMQRMIDGIDHLCHIATMWEPDWSSGSDRRGWMLAGKARDEARAMLSAAQADTQGNT